MGIRTHHVALDTLKPIYQFRLPRLSRRYWYDHRWSAIWFLLILFILWRTNSLAPPEAGPDPLDEGMYDVLRHVDGDTIVLKNGARVRLQGINCRESVKPDAPVERWGPEASQYTKDFLKRAHHRVRLTFGLERKDQYDRLLAFVWDGDVMLNEELVRAGLAEARLGYRYSGAMKRRLAAAQDEARAAKRGIWSNANRQPATDDNE